MKGAGAALMVGVVVIGATLRLVTTQGAMLLALLGCSAIMLGVAWSITEARWRRIPLEKRTPLTPKKKRRR